jgi:hypothetical protein
MSFLVVALTLLALPGAEPCRSSEGAKPRGFDQWNSDLQASMRREACAKTRAQRAAAITQLCELYRQLAADPRLPASPTLQGYLAKLRRRLATVERDLKREIAQQAAPTAGGDRKTRKQGRPPTEEGANSLADLSAGPSGGAAVAVSDIGASGGAAGPQDYGPALVALIQRTITPALWDVNGGPGTIIYYPPCHALVVRATTEMHEDVVKVLKGLRDAAK